MKKELSKQFIGFLCYLIVAFILATVYTIAGATGNLIITEETMSALAGVIVFDCIMLIPPIICIIVTIVDKKIFYIIPTSMSEEELAKNGVKTTIATNEDILEINDYVDKFDSNEKIQTICRNYANNIGVCFSILEYIFIPMHYFHLLANKYIIATGKVLVPNTDFLKQVSLYNQDTLNNNPSIVMYAHTLLYNQHYYDYGFSNYVIEGSSKKKYIKDDFARKECKMDKRTKIFTNAFIELQEEMNSINSLFKSLINQHILECEDEINSYRAFLYLLYRYKKIAQYENAISIFESVGINIDDNIGEGLIKKLLNNDVDSSIIPNLIRSLNSKKHDFNDLLFDSENKIDEETQAIIKKINEQQKVESLLNPNKEKSNFNIVDIDLMSGEQFESFITYLFNKLGYEATNTKLSGDQGIDVIATKGKTKVAIQAKCYSKPVGNHAIMEAVAGAKHYGADKVMVVTNNYFTKSAKELAESNNVILWDRNILKEKMEQI